MYILKYITYKIINRILKFDPKFIAYLNLKKINSEFLCFKFLEVPL